MKSPPWKQYAAVFTEDPIILTLVTWLGLVVLLLGWVLAFGMPESLHWFLTDFWNLGYSLALFGLSFLLYMLGRHSSGDVSEKH